MKKAATRTVVLLALLVATLGGALAIRTANRTDQLEPLRRAKEPRHEVPSRIPDGPPRGAVPPPVEVSLGELPTPHCWTCPIPTFQPLVFHVDLDLLAPLGDGDENAAIWFRDFAKTDGSRLDELNERELVETMLRGKRAKLFAPDNPLLLEAEPWVDQSKCRFYPDVWEVTGAATPIPNLLFVLNLSKSWVARGDANTDPVEAMKDYRRAVRLGRLYMREDVVLITNLVGLACIRMGLEGLYDRAREQGDAVRMTAASLALGDAMAIRKTTSERIAEMDLIRHAREGWIRDSLNATNSRVEAVIASARNDPSRPLRSEAIVQMFAARHAGTKDQRRMVNSALDELMNDPDPHVAAMARWARLDNPTWNAIRKMLGVLD